ncbi:hypothetical protein Golomagni_05457 [Golovinomyces magnicellulatus]|nr:hypothetical protein Golomagni_05457 [Golovinomyces magnicellulatus]
MTTAIAVPKFSIRTFQKREGLDEPTSVSIDFRRDEQAVVGSNASPVETTPEARCGTHVYYSEYIKRTLATVAELESKGATAGTSGYPQPFGDEGHVMIFPLQRSDEIFDGAVIITEGKSVGPDRIAVGMEGKKYTIFTAEGQSDVERATEFDACEYLVPKTASLTTN